MQTIADPSAPRRELACRLTLKSPAVPAADAPAADTFEASSSQPPAAASPATRNGPVFANGFVNGFVSGSISGFIPGMLSGTLTGTITGTVTAADGKVYSVTAFLNDPINVMATSQEAAPQKP